MYFGLAALLCLLLQFRCVYFLSLRVDYFASAAAPASRRARATEYSVMPAATEAFSDSTMFDIGMPAMESHVSRTRRLRPLPSEPSTTTRRSVRTGFANEGVAATVETNAVVSAFLQAFNGFGEVHHAGDRHVRGCACGHLPCGCGDRSGTTFRQDHAVGAECGCGTDDRARFCGSVTPSSAMNSGRAAMRALAELAASMARDFLSARSTSSASEEYWNAAPSSPRPDGWRSVRYGPFPVGRLP